MDHVSQNHDDVTSTLNKFFWHVEKECYGRQAKRNKLLRFPVLEYSASQGSHIHVLMVKPHDKHHRQFRDIVRAKWQRLDGTGKANMTNDSQFYQSINHSDTDRVRVSNYINKMVKSNYNTVIFQCM